MFNYKLDTCIIDRCIFCSYIFSKGGREKNSKAPFGFVRAFLTVYTIGSSQTILVVRLETRALLTAMAGLGWAWWPE